MSKNEFPQQNTGALAFAVAAQLDAQLAPARGASLDDSQLFALASDIAAAVGRHLGPAPGFQGHQALAPVQDGVAAGRA